MAPLPEDDSHRPADQQAWTLEQRHVLTRHVDEEAREAIETPGGVESIPKRLLAETIRVIYGGSMIYEC